MNISLICACKNRYDSLIVSLNSWLRFKEIKEIIIVDWTSDETFENIVSLDSRIKIIRVENKKHFNLSQPLNLAAYQATGDYIFKVDTDYLLNPYSNFFGAYPVDQNSFVSGNCEIRTTDTLDQNGSFMFEFNREDLDLPKLAEYVNSYNHFFKFLKGLLYVSRENFMKVGGYNEDITSYGWEDTDMVSRLELLNLKHKKISHDYSIIHLPHSDRKRFENSEKYSEELENQVKEYLSQQYQGEELQWQTDYVITTNFINDNKVPDISSHYIQPKTKWDVQETSERYYLATQIDGNKLEGFPSVYYLSLEECEDRRAHLEEQFAKYNIQKFTPIISKRFAQSDDVITGKCVYQLNDGTKGCAVSHLKAIKKWYNDTDEEYAFFCEDDLSFETVDDWDFTWKEFMKSLPDDWECVQLLYLKTDGNVTSLKLRGHEWDDWAVTAYLTKRSYAKKLIESYCIGDTYHLELSNPDMMPLVENLIYDMGKTYSVPLFVENIILDTTFSQDNEHNADLHSQTHKGSRDSTVKLWKNKTMKKSKKIVDYFPFFAPTGREMLELRINMLQDYVDEFVICESNKTQSGIPIEYELEKIIEELNIPSEKIKIIHLEIPDDEDLDIQEIDHHNCYDGNSSNLNSLRARVRERMQKDALLSVLDDYDDDAVFIHSDIDEIVKPDCINYIASVVRQNLDIAIRIPLVHLEGRADLRVYIKDADHPKEWNGMFFGTKQHLKKATPTQIRSNVFNPFPISFLTENGVMLNDLGWHFSWMGSPETRKVKCKAFTHYDDKFEYLSTSKYGNEDTEEFQESLTLKVGSISPSGDKNTILKRYDTNKLPREVYELSRVKEFLLPEIKEDKKSKKSFIVKALPFKKKSKEEKSEIENLMSNFSMDTENPESNFSLGIWYENQGHTAPALSYYLRCAERSEDKDLTYEALIRGSFCYDKQGTRDDSTRSLIQQAFCFNMERPEAYFLLSHFAEKHEWWRDCYIFAEQGLNYANFDLKPLRTDVGYPGRFGLLFEKAISGWWWGKAEESKNILLDLKENYELPENYLNSVNDNLKKMN
jgi:GR25 family glycosyltransferase involved in LPS biosynthesis